MLIVTERAKQQLKEVLMENTDDPEVGLRLMPESSGELGLQLSKQYPSDTLIIYEGAKVLLLSPELIVLLDKAIIDVRDSPTGPALSLSLSGANREDNEDN